MTMRNDAIMHRSDIVAAVDAALKDSERSGRWLAKKLSLSPAYIQRRLSGEVEFSATDLERVAQVLNRSVASFYGITSLAGQPVSQ